MYNLMRYHVFLYDKSFFIKILVALGLHVKQGLYWTDMDEYYFHMIAFSVNSIQTFIKIRTLVLKIRHRWAEITSPLHVHFMHFSNK
jgi:hypothetical protein